MEGLIFVYGWEDLFDQISDHDYSLILSLFFLNFQFLFVRLLKVYKPSSYGDGGLSAGKSLGWLGAKYAFQWKRVGWESKI